MRHFLFAILFLIFASYHQGVHCLVQPTPSLSSWNTPISVVAAAAAQPTDGPQLSEDGKRVIAKRDNQIQATLSLYQDWASVCNNDNDNQDYQVNTDADASIRKLWQTVTETVYCGNGRVMTVTRTITATAIATATVYSGSDGQVECDAQCWSDYLWHTYGYGISVAQGFTGIVCILIGIVFMLFGFRFFRPTLALAGFVFFATMTWIGLVNNEPATGYPHTEIVYICVSVGLGLLGAVSFMFFYQFGLYFVGVDGGFYLAVYIMSWRENLVIQIKVARVCFIVAMGVVLAIFIFLLESYAVIFATSFVGAYLFFLGLDFFVHTGFVNAMLLIFDGNSNHYNAYIMNQPVYIMLAFVGALTLISAGWQYYWNIHKNQRYFGINVETEKPPEPEKAA